ncbi:MAG: multicopper oxidase domain-containing protein, partial [Candidatus Eremiobacteraeota bacterium]|nr:multicopper oxidase domain-containing protein [Candidatus Eremiobacteraeota bacterium]
MRLAWASVVMTWFFTGCGIAGGGGSPSISSAPTAATLSQDLANPIEVVAGGGMANVSLAAVIDPATGGPAVSYKGVLVMPTIRVSPGDTIAVTYTNQLPASTTEPYNDTSLHFHGLTVSPNAPGDDSIDVLAMPGQTLHYTIAIPASQPPGVFWYHPHPHGESNWQVYNGMTGAIVVQGIASIATETTGLPERIVILRNLLQAPKFTSLSVRRRTVTPAASDRSVASAPSTVCSQPFGIGGEYTTIDGRLVGGPIVMRPGQKQLWRIVNASADGYYNLSVDGQTLHVVSIDGVAIKQYPGATESDVSNIVIPPAGRADVIVTGPTHSGVAFRTTCFDTGPGGDPNPPQVLGIINTGTPANLPLVPAPGATPRALGTYDRSIGAAIAQNRTVAFSEDANGFYLNGQAYNPNGAPMFVARAGTVERWTLTN